MTGSIHLRKTSSGNKSWYISLRYKDHATNTWRTKEISTHLPEKNNKKKALALIPSTIAKFRYLEAAYGNPNIKVTEYLQAWLNSKSGKIRQTTYEKYEYQVHALLSRYLSSHDRPVAEIDARYLQDLVDYMLAYGKRNQHTGNPEPLSVSAVRDYKSIMSEVIDMAVLDNLLPANPISSVKIPAKRKRKDEKLLFLHEEEYEPYLRLVASYSSSLFFLAYIAIYYGLRRSELLGLTWDDVDDKNAVLHVRHTIVRVRTTHASDDTKTPASERDLILFPEAQELFRMIREDQEHNRSIYGNAYLNDHNYVFTWNDGKSYNPDYISRIFRKIAIAFNRPDITLHKLRHTCATYYISHGWTQKEVQYWLGHSDASTTAGIYEHFDKILLNRKIEISDSEVKLLDPHIFLD